jgi:hypothetical protein
MKAKRIFLYVGLLFLSLTMFSLYSCKKSASTDANETTANDNNLADNTSSDAQAVGDQAVANAPSITKALILSSSIGDSLKSQATTLSSSSGKDSVTITWVRGDTAGAGSITIDFGTGFTCKDGRTRSGEITVSWTGRYLATGTRITYSSSNYTVNSNKISFTKTVTNLGQVYDSIYTTLLGNPLEFSVFDTLTLTKSGGGIVTWGAHRTRIMMWGWWNPFKFWNICYAIRGGGTGTTASGASYTHKILADLIKPVIIKQYIAGIYRISAPKETITIMAGQTGKLVNWKTWYGITSIPELYITEENNTTGASISRIIPQE